MNIPEVFLKLSKTLLTGLLLEVGAFETVDSGNDVTSFVFDMDLDRMLILFSRWRIISLQTSLILPGEKVSNSKLLIYE